MKIRSGLTLGIIMGFCFAASQVTAAVIYSEDFEGPAPDLTPWGTSGPALVVTADEATPAHHVLGSEERLGSGLFNSNETVSLTLSSVAAGWYTFQFDFFAIYTWDGDGSGCCGPDLFNVAINGTTVLDDYFNQSVPYRRDDELELSYIYYGSEDPGHSYGEEVVVFNSAYLLEFLFYHGGGDLQVDFAGNTDQAGQENYDSGFPDEPWALDNILLQTAESPAVPEPVTLALMGLGLAGIGIARGRRKS